jgi:hypothetical protein
MRYVVFYRAHIGGGYRVTPLQFSQTERKLANLSSLKSTSSNSSTKREEKKSSLEWNDAPLLRLTKEQIDEDISLCNFSPLIDHDYAKPFHTFTLPSENSMQNLSLVEIDLSTKSTLEYIRGSIMRKLLNHSTCSHCIDTLIQNVQPSSSSAYLIQMDFSGNSLLQPSVKMMSFFHMILTVYIHFKNAIKHLSLNQNVLEKLCCASQEFLNSNDFSLSFCKNHHDLYTHMMIQSSMKTFLKAFIHEINEIFSREQNQGHRFQKNRKLQIMASK